MDPLSDVLSLVKIRNLWSERFEWGKEWCLAFGTYEGVRTYAVISGECWLAVDGVAKPVHGKAGDCLLLPSGRQFRVGSNLKLQAIDAQQLSSGTHDKGMAKRYAGDAFTGVGGYFTFGGEHSSLLTDALPPILHVHHEADKALLRWTLERLAEELRAPQPGSSLVGQQLATMLLVQALRVHLADASARGVGWLFALADRRIGAAMTAIHNDPSRRWTVQLLGQQAGMSRTSFAVRFKEAVGKSPVEYLTKWRMMLACDKLTKSDDPISLIAESLGYESESAFSTAFKRVMHCSPRRYCQTSSEV